MYEDIRGLNGYVLLNTVTLCCNITALWSYNYYNAQRLKNVNCIYTLKRM